MKFVIVMTKGHQNRFRTKTAPYGIGLPPKTSKTTSLANQIEISQKTSKSTETAENPYFRRFFNFLIVFKFK
jgi:hypothetical protein